MIEHVSSLKKMSKIVGFHSRDQLQHHKLHWIKEIGSWQKLKVDSRGLKKPTICKEKHL